MNGTIERQGKFLVLAIAEKKRHYTAEKILKKNSLSDFRS